MPDRISEGYTEALNAIAEAGREIARAVAAVTATPRWVEHDFTATTATVEPENPFRLPAEQPWIDGPVPAEQPQPASGGNGTGGGLGGRLRALGTGQTRSLRKELREIADEVDRAEEARDLHRADANSMLQQKDQWRDSANVAEAKVERVRAQLVRMTKSSDEGTRRHGTALLRILDGRDETNEKGEGA